MKSKLFVLGAASLLLASCSNELDVPVNQAIAGGGTTPLGINVLANPTTKALVEGNTIQSGQIGVKLVDAGGSTYDNLSYNNIFYSTTDGTTWTVDPDHKILLSATEGKAYAYYPYSSDVSDFTAILISSAADPNQQVDYMYGNEATGLKNSNPTASFTMSHAMSIVNFTIAKGTYTGTGSITSVKMKGNTASNKGTMNAVAGTVTATNNGYEFESTTGLTLSSSSTGKFIVVPSGVTSKLDFKVVMDGQTYTASATDVKLESGQVYKYTLTMNSTGLTVSQVSVTRWGDPQNIGTGSGDASLLLPPAALAENWTGLPDGVYAIRPDGKPANATLANELCSVAFVLNGNAYQVAKTDAKGDENSDNVYWWYDYQDVSALTDIKTVDGTASRLFGFLAGSNTPQLSKIPSEWTDGALADFNGQANTELIIAAQGNGTTVKTLGKAVMDFRGNSTVNEGQTDWYAPACGQLAFMFLKMTELNTLLSKVGGTQFSSNWYWSSSEYSSGDAWLVGFSGGNVSISNKSGSYRLRLVRAI